MVIDHANGTYEAIEEKSLQEVKLLLWNTHSCQFHSSYRIFS